MVQTHLFKGDIPGAEAAITEAKAGKLDPHTAAALDEQSAQLHDDKPGLIDAEHKLFALSPGDIAILRTVAEREMAAGQFAQSAADWKKLSDILPDDPGALNSLAYARSFAGDLTGALQALEAYGKLRPNDANVQDSMGDVNYGARRFREAAAQYAQSSAKDPQFLHGGDLYKTAWAKFRAGDKTGGDASFAQFKAARLKLNEQSMPILESDWLYRTGRTKEAMALLRNFAGSNENSNRAVHAAAAAQLAIWDLIAGDRTAAAADGLNAGPPNTIPIAIVRFSVLPSASAAEWKSRAEKMMGGPGAAGLRRSALAYALLLDGKPNDALPLWREIVKASPATDLFPQAIVARVEGTKPVRPIIPDPNAVNQFGALVPD
jgi:tetratricopeptide (TPR) repeat protein